MPVLERPQSSRRLPRYGRRSDRAARVFVPAPDAPTTITPAHQTETYDEVMLERLYAAEEAYVERVRSLHYGYSAIPFTPAHGVSAGWSYLGTSPRRTDPATA